MIPCTSPKVCVKTAFSLSGLTLAHMSTTLCSIVSYNKARRFCIYSQKIQNCSPSSVSKPFLCIDRHRSNSRNLSIKTIVCPGVSLSWKKRVEAVLACGKGSLRVQRKVTFGTGALPFSLSGFVYASLVGGMLVFLSNSNLVHAEASREDKSVDDSLDEKISHGKKVHTDYSVIGIPGDGRCLFRSVVHGACLRSGKPPPSETLQREMADELRARVVDEFLKRRGETEWFIEGDFDAYVCQMRKPHVWGGEPELLMASHVLKMPITVYMHDEDSGGLISIAEYGQQYGQQDSIRILYHGFGHYDALQFPRNKFHKSRL